MINKQDFKKYAIGFVAGLAIMAVARLFILLNDSGTKSNAAPIDGLPMLYNAGPTSPFWWVLTGFGTGVRVLPDPSLQSCVLVTDDDGNRYYDCGPAPLN